MQTENRGTHLADGYELSAPIRQIASSGLFCLISVHGPETELQ